MKRHAHGFTLMEVLLAVSLLAAALALAFGILRAAGATVQRGDAQAQRDERMRAASDFLRGRIGGAQAIVFDFDRDNGRSLRYVGDATSMRFVADLPDYLGRGGPYLHVLQVQQAAGGATLVVEFRMVQAARALPPAGPPEALATGLRQVVFAYRGLADDGQPGPWQPRWEAADTLPLQVRVRIADAAGAWPDMLVTLPLAGTTHAASGEVRQ